MTFGPNSTDRLRRLGIEAVEPRVLMAASISDVAPAAIQESVLSLPILVPSEGIPDFAAYPTVVSVQSGDWNDAATWGGRLPTID